MTKIQENLLALLVEIDTICRENDIDYSLAGGTLIGAVRQKGFLPWDDDADVHMTIENAEKLLSLPKDAIPANRVIVRKEDYPSYPNIVWRYTCTDNTSLQRSNYIEDCPKGLYIDIILMQPVSENQMNSNEFRDMWNAFSEISVETYPLYSRRSEYVTNIYNKAKHRRFYGGDQIIKHNLQQRLTAVEEKDAAGYFVMSQMMTNFFSKELINGYCDVTFEGEKLRVFNNAKKILFRAYGENWFEIPEQKFQERHVIIHDFERPYTEYDNIRKSWVDGEQVHKVLRHKKDLWYRTLDDYNYVNPRTHLMRSQAVTQEIQHFIDKQEIDLKEWVRDERYNELKLLFSRYYNVQFSETSTYWGIYLPLPDLSLWAAWYPQVMEGNCGRARKILAMRKEKGSLSLELEELTRLLSRIAELHFQLYVNENPKGSLAIAEEELKKHPNQIHLARAKIHCRLALNKEVDDALSAALKMWPGDPELLKYQGDVAYKRGDFSQAMRFYQSVRNTIRNGIEWTDLQKRITEMEIGNRKMV